MNRKAIKIILLILSLALLLMSCKRVPKVEEKGMNGLNNHKRKFDFSDESQLDELRIAWKDYSYIEDGRLKAPIKAGEHKGLGRKFRFKESGAEPDEAQLEFKIFLDKNFQKDGAKNEIGKFLGFEGIYDKSAGWGGKKVSHQRSWTLRIGHGAQNADGKVPLALYIYHPGMKGKYGTTVDLNYSMELEKFYTLRLYTKLNDVGKENAVIAFSVDGEEIYRDNEWLLREDSSVHIKSVWLNSYIGGKTPSKYDTFTLMDDLIIWW